MFNYLTVAEILGAGWTSLDAQQAHETLEEAFMTPDIEDLTSDEAREYTDDLNAEAGIYARLSASGYLDSTDWSGPFGSYDHAMAYLIETYANF